MLDEKFISGELKLQKICELPGASLTGPRPGIWPGSTGGPTAPPNPQLLNCNDRGLCRAW